MKLTEQLKAKTGELTGLLAEDAEVHRGDQTVHGRAEGAALLQGFDCSDARVHRHHDVTAMICSDSRVLLLQRSAQDLITRAIVLPAPGGDAMLWQGVLYDRAWNTNEEQARKALLDAVWAKDGRYVDSDVDVVGRDGVDRTIAKLRNVVPSAHVETTTGMTDAGDGWRTWDWIIRNGSMTWFNGFDVMHLDAEGKIDLLAGFFVKR